MNDDLRSPLVAALERLAVDVAVERYGDPHVAFVVFVSPDGAPQVAVLSDKGLTHFGKVRLGVPESERNTKPGRFFSQEDLQEAYLALSDARYGATDRRWRPDPQRPLSADIEDGWQKRRDAAIERQIAQTDHAIRYAAECPHCHSRYTVKGIKIHLARSRYCSEQETRRVAAETAATA